MPSPEPTARQRIFELFDDAARIANRIGDRPLATLALGASMLAARPMPRKRQSPRQSLARAPRHRPRSAKTLA